MRYIISVILLIGSINYSPAQEIVSGEAGQGLGNFRIIKVSRVEKLWVIPPDRRGFMGSRGIRKFDYVRPIPPDQRGEHYVVTWRYRGDELKGSLVLKFEYNTAGRAKEPYIEEFSWPDLRSGSYRWTFKNIGSRFSEIGKVDRWKVSLIYGEKVVARKRSATWRTMEGS